MKKLFIRLIEAFQALKIFFSAYKKWRCRAGICKKPLPLHRHCNDCFFMYLY